MGPLSKHRAAVESTTRFPLSSSPSSSVEPSVPRTTHCSFYLQVEKESWKEEKMEAFLGMDILARIYIRQGRGELAEFGIRAMKGTNSLVR